MNSYDREAQPILYRLRKSGIRVSTFAELRRHRRYLEALPILLASLPNISDKDLKEDVVRSLSVPGAGPQVAKALVEQFETVEDMLLKWAIANGLSIIGDQSVAEDLFRLASDKRHGRAREMLVLSLGRLKHPNSIPIARALLEDQEVEGHALRALGQLNAADARSDIEKRLQHPRAWVRNEARRALAKLDKIAGKKSKHLR
jgi:HEAT repeat protein